MAVATRHSPEEYYESGNANFRILRFFFAVNEVSVGEIWDSHSGDYEDCCLVEWDAV